MINIAKLLKNCPKGTKLYSPLFGEVKFKYINDSEFGIVVEDSEECCRSFDKYGRYFTIYNNAECLLFPSKECRTWEGWKVPSKPNFKVNDWIIFDKTITIPIQIVEVNQKDGVYRCKSIEGFYGHYNIAQTDKEYHLWSIADANDGDILAADECYVIFKEIDWLNIKCYCTYHYMGFNPSFCIDTLQNKTAFSPATKEQRGLLFSKMQEAGYEWDADKKELHKIKSHYNIANFHAGMPVLVREYDTCCWQWVLYSHFNGVGLFFAAGKTWRQCIPFNEKTKHLLGTTDMPSEEFINW